MKIRPARRLRGRVQLPGDKSISHRAALLAALAEGHSRLSNYATGADCAATLNCLRQLGVGVERDGTSVSIAGVGTRGLRASDKALDCGNSGSTMRLLAGVLAGQDFSSVLTGDESLRRRPMGRITEPLELMGARVTSTAGRAPLRIEGGQPLVPISYEMTIPSAQVKSCLLLAGLNARGHTAVIEEPNLTRDHTERMLRWFGVPVTTRPVQCDDVMKSCVVIDGPAQLAARDVTIPGDISSAAFFIAAASLLPGSHLRLEATGLNPTRTQILSTLRALGMTVRMTDVREQCNEPTGEIEVRGDSIGPSITGDKEIESEKDKARVWRGARIARLIDELPVLSVVGSQLPGGLEIRDAAELRVKESDRISATVENLRAMGAMVEEFADGLRVQGRTQLRGAQITTHGDHRIAMAFAVAALLAEGETELDDAECVDISFPEFFTLLESVTER